MTEGGTHRSSTDGVQSIDGMQYSGVQVDVKDTTETEAEKKEHEGILEKKKLKIVEESDKIEEVSVINEKSSDDSQSATHEIERMPASSESDSPPNEHDSATKDHDNATNDNYSATKEHDKATKEHDSTTEDYDATINQLITEDDLKFLETEKTEDGQQIQQELQQLEKREKKDDENVATDESNITDVKPEEEKNNDDDITLKEISDATEQLPNGEDKINNDATDGNNNDTEEGLYNDNKTPDAIYTDAENVINNTTNDIKTKPNVDNVDDTAIDVPKRDTDINFNADIDDFLNETDTKPSLEEELAQFTNDLQKPSRLKIEDDAVSKKKSVPRKSVVNMDALEFETDFLARRIQEGRDQQAYLNSKVLDKDRQLEIAETKVKDLKLRLIRFTKDDQAKDKRIASLENELKEINKKLEDLLDEYQTTKSHVKADTPSKQDSVKQNVEKVPKSTMCVLL